MGRRAIVLSALLLVALSGAAAQNDTSSTTSTAAASSSAESAQPVPSWAIFDPTAFSGLTNTLQTQFGFLQSNWGSYVSQVVSGLPTGILNLKTEATQLIADGSEQFAVLTDASQQTTCSPPVFVEPTKVPTQCVGPVFKYTIDGGHCVIKGQNGPVVCSAPKISLATDSAYCNLKFHTATQIKDTQCAFVKTFGDQHSKTVKGGDPVTYKIAELLPVDSAAGSGSSGSAAASSSSSSGSKPSRPSRPSKPSKPSKPSRRVR